MMQGSQTTLCYDVKRGDDRIDTILRTGRLESCCDDVDAFLNEIQFWNLQPSMLRLYVGMDIYITAQSFSKELGISHERFACNCGSMDEMTAHLQTIESTTVFFYGLVRQCISWRMESAADHSSTIIRKARGYIDKNYMQSELSLCTVAGAVGLSPTYFSALFKKETGQNFSDYLTAVRVRHAKDLLCCTTKLISEIAYDVGFRDYRYFSQIFKKHTGQTPRQFQNSSNAWGERAAVSRP